MMLGQGGGSLQQQGALTRTRIAANEHNRARHKATPEHTIQLGEPGADPFGVYRFNITQFFYFGGNTCIAYRGGRNRRDVDPTEGIPRTTGTTLTLPFAVLGTAVVAYVGGLGFCFCQRGQAGCRLVPIVVVHLVGQILELGEVARKLQTYFANGSITLLADDDFGNT